MLENGALQDTVTGNIVDPLIVRLDEREQSDMRIWLGTLDVENERGFLYDMKADGSFKIKKAK